MIRSRPTPCHRWSVAAWRAFGAARLSRVLAAVLIALFAAPAVAPAEERPARIPAPGSVCGERDALVKRLEADYGETRRGYGLQRGASVVEVYVSERSGSWTILVTMPDGVACLVAAGEHWAPTPEEAQAALGPPV